MQSTDYLANVDPANTNSFTVSDICPRNAWFHLVIQKAGGSHDIQYYVDGTLAHTFSPASPLSNIDQVWLSSDNAGAPVVREVMFHNVAKYSTNFTIPHGARWNAIMI